MPMARRKAGRQAGGERASQRLELGCPGTQHVPSCPPRGGVYTRSRGTARRKEGLHGARTPVIQDGEKKSEQNPTMRGNIIASNAVSNFRQICTASSLKLFIDSQKTPRFSASSWRLARAFALFILRLTRARASLGGALANTSRDSRPRASSRSQGTRLVPSAVASPPRVDRPAIGIRSNDLARLESWAWESGNKSERSNWTPTRRS